ncbi:LPS export ABC transporter periplasmic protein LptC [Bacteriovoracaceae bacterium]|nr:LPS export ABC transporter periplasmic protein LptC [Bacteriovoracaceae bacterium]
MSNIVQRSSVKKASKFARKEVENFSEFSSIELYGISNFKPSLKLVSDYLDIRENDRMEFISPSGVIYNMNEKPIDTDFKASEGAFSFTKNKLELSENVEFKTPNLKIESQQLNFFTKTSVFSAKGGVKIISRDKKSGDKIKVNSLSMRGNLNNRYYEYSGDVKASLRRKRIYESGVDFSSLKMIMNLQESTVLMEGDVVFKRNKFSMLAGKAELFLSNYNKTLKYYVLYDDIRLQEKLRLKDGSEMIRRAFADKIEGFNLDRKLVLTGSPRVIQGEDIIKGYRVTLREDLEMVEVDDSASSFSLKKKE